PAVFRPAADVKSQVDLFKVSVEGNRQAENARLQKEESDDADEMTVIPSVEFHAARYERTQRRRIDLVIEHRQSWPFRREKFSCSHLDSPRAESVPLRPSLNQKSPRDAMKQRKSQFVVPPLGGSVWRHGIGLLLRLPPKGGTTN